MRLHDSAYDTETQTTSPLGTGHALIDLIKPVEDTAGSARAQADAIVTNRMSLDRRLYRR